MKGRTVHFAIATPSIEVGISPWAARWIEFLRRAYPQDAFTPLHVASEKPVYKARNILCKAFLDGPYDAIAWLDADQRPKKSSVRLFAAPQLDILGGLTVCYYEKANTTKPMLHASVFVYNPDKKKFQFAEWSRDVGPVPVDLLGGGCLIVQRRVYEDRRMRMPSTYLEWDGSKRSLDDEPDEPPAFYNVREKPNGTCIWSEDQWFTWRAKQLGYGVWFDPRIRFGHMKPVDLLQFTEFSEEDL
jgi:hypothetical protein